MILVLLLVPCWILCNEMGQHLEEVHNLVDQCFLNSPRMML